MAIINNNVQNVKFLRNGSVFTPSGEDSARQVAKNVMKNQLSSLDDGTAILGRYQESNGTIKTLVGFAYVSGETKTLTIIDVEGIDVDIEELKARLGTGVTTANTATAQLAALSGNNQSTSAETSVEGAKRYADDLVDTLEYTGVTTGTGVYVTNVTEVDGIVSATTATLPSVTDTKEAKKVIVSVSEDKGTISVERGTISSSAETMVLTDNADGGVNFEVNIDGASIVQDPTSKKIKVADSALTQYFGDEKTIHAEVDATTNKKTFNTLLKIVKNANPSETEVKEEYFLADADGTAITGADKIKIYKDSHIVSITYITDSGDTHYQNLEYKYIDASGATKTEYVDISSLVLEAEFASGVTITNHVAHGVVDPTSEANSGGTAFLTVGADGFKVNGIKQEIIDRINELDASVTGGATAGTATADHVQVVIDEADGKLTAVTVTETNIADADDLTELSAKTITEITSTNDSIDITTANTSDGTVEVDVITDASKIKMSGFTSADALSGINSSSSITEAFEEVDKVITDNEQVVSNALNDLEARKIENIEVNGVSGTVTDNVATVTIGGADVNLTNYVSGSTSGAVVPTDTVNQAIGKLENQIKAAVAGGLQQVNSGSGITVSAVANNQQTIDVKLADANNITGVTENAIKFNATDNGLYIDVLDCGTYGE